MKKKKRENINYYWKIFGHNKILLFFTILFSIIVSAGGAAIALLLKKIIDITVSGDTEGFSKALAINILYLLVFAVLFYSCSLLNKILLRNVIKNMRESIFNGIVTRNYRDFFEENTADYISVLTNDIKTVEENYIRPLIEIIQYVMSFLFTIVFLMMYSPLITMILFVGFILMLLIPGAIGGRLQGKQKDLSGQYSIFTARTKDLFSGFEVIKSFQLLGHMKSQFHQENDTLSEKKFKADKLFVLNETASQFLAIFSQVITIFTAAYLVMRGDITMGTLIAIIQLSGSFVMPLMLIMQNFPKIQSVAPIMKRMSAFVNYSDDSFKGTIQPEFKDNIVISDLSFTYHEEQPVLENVNLEIKKGKKYAIIGESGCGKSTLVKLMMGYYSNFTGDINFDQTRLKDSDVTRLSELASIIHQNVYMFDKSIKENICLFQNYSKERLDLAIQLSGVDKFLPVMQEQLDTEVGENGANLSGGQRQRIAIARALVKGTPILILDEGTSAIDLQTSRDIEQNLLKNRELTLITITHKLSEELLNLYDQIIYMEKGRIVEMGSYKQLWDTKSKFYSFCMN